MGKVEPRKTNAMRVLDGRRIAYKTHEYENRGEALPGAAVAEKLGVSPGRMYKTLVTQGASRNYFVFVIPVAAELDLKAAAKSVGEKSVTMIPAAELNKVTGYFRGGCSPIGMKKSYPTMFDQSALAQDAIIVSAGKIGLQVELAPGALIALVNGSAADLIRQETQG